MENLLGGEEGVTDVGVSVARLLPNPWLFLEVTGQIFSGNAEGVFTSSSPGEVTYLGRLRAYQDLSESTNLDLGALYARGHNGTGIVADTDLGRLTTSLYGVDATLRWKPPRRSIYRSFVGRAETVWSWREQSGGPQHARGSTDRAIISSREPRSCRARSTRSSALRRRADMPLMLEAVFMRLALLAALSSGAASAYWASIW
jgi:hypothetical protein